jgi:hypothetical protein
MSNRINRLPILPSHHPKSATPSFIASMFGDRRVARQTRESLTPSCCRRILLTPHLPLQLGIRQTYLYVAGRTCSHFGMRPVKVHYIILQMHPASGNMIIPLGWQKSGQLRVTQRDIHTYHIHRRYPSRPMAASHRLTQQSRRHVSYNWNSFSSSLPILHLLMA